MEVSPVPGAWAHFSISNLTAVISDLRKEGHQIEATKNDRGLTLFKYPF